jgi:cystathionine beta-lyase/cystathionine gamma-synthase
MAEFEAAAADPPSGFLYTRYQNPTVRQAEDALARLEAADAALLFSSGMAAITTSLLTLLKPGDHVLAMRSVYGGAFKFLRTHLPAIGVETEFLETADLGGFESRIRPSTRLLYLETPTNPILTVVDLADLGARARARGLLTFVDSTFGTPVAQRPVELGCDLSMHSTSKYLGGHSDIIGGAVSGSEALIGPIREQRKVYGGVADPFAAWLLLRGMRTLAVRMEAHEARAMRLAKELSSLPKIKRVFYPGLPAHPGHDLARRQMSCFGGMLTVELGSLDEAKRAMDKFQVVRRASSLGGVESLSSIPVMTSHTGYSDEELRRAGVSPGMIRLSIGLEDAEDLLEDLRQAFA